MEQQNKYYVIVSERATQMLVSHAARGSLTNYKEHNFTSIVEHLAEKRLEAEERYKRHLAEIEEMHRKRLERNSKKPEK